MAGCSCPRRGVVDRPAHGSLFVQLFAHEVVRRQAEVRRLRIELRHADAAVDRGLFDSQPVLAGKVGAQGGYAPSQCAQLGLQTLQRCKKIRSVSVCHGRGRCSFDMCSQLYFKAP